MADKKNMINGAMLVSNRYLNNNIYYIYIEMKRPYVITLHYKNNLISKFNLKYPEQAFEYANDNLITVMRDEKIPIKEIKRMFLLFVEQFYTMRVNKVKCKSSDHNLFMAAFLALMKMNIIQDNNENGFIITKRKLKNKKLKFIN